MGLLEKVIKSSIIGILAGIGVALFTHFFFSSLIDRLEHVSYYMRYRWEYSSLSKEKLKEITDNQNGIAIIDIDDRSMQKMGFYYNWDRSYHAELIDNLSKKYPAAIVFDILFSNPEDANHRKRLEKMFARSCEMNPAVALSDNVRKSIISTIDYDKRFIEATRKAANVYLGVILSDENDYESFALSQIKNRMTLEWHNSLSPASTISLSQNKRATILDQKSIIDGIFPELARAARAIGHVDVDFVPSADGIIRELPLLYGFKNFDPVYLPISLRTAASLFATPNEEIMYEPGKYVDIGKPFKIFCDKSGKKSVSYPHVSISQIRAICRRSTEILSLKDNEKLAITSFLAAQRDSNGCISIEMAIPGNIPCQIVSALMSTNIENILNSSNDQPTNLKDDITIRKDSESDWVISAPFDAGEWYLTSNDLQTISLLSESDLSDLKAGEQKLIFHNFSVRISNGVLTSSIPVLRQETLIELCKTGWDQIKRMAPETRMDFGRNVQIPLTPHNRHIITFFGPHGKPFPTFSYYDILKDRAQGQFDGKIFIVGSTAPALFDIKAVPIANNYPGVEIHASLLNSFLTNTFIRQLTNWQNMLILLLVGSIIGFFSYMFKPLVGSFLSLISIFIYFLIAMTVFNTEHLWIEIARPVLTIFLTFATIMVYRYITEEKDRKFLQNTFKQYLSPELIDIMYKNKQQPLLGGEEGIRTAYFTDIQGFSTFSEKIGSPTRLVGLLNEYLSEMTDTLLKHYGTLDKYEGDAIIAFFGAPMHMDDHAYQACLTALDMQQSLDKLRKKWVSEGEKWPTIVHEMRMRIGINSGLITTGNMGSIIRKNYTMMGDAVNLAARLESAAKQYGIFTMISHNTYNLVKDSFEVRQLDKILVVGKSQPVIIYELIAQKGALSINFHKLLPIYNEGLEYFYAKEWDKAIQKLQEAHLLEPYMKMNQSRMTPSLKIIQYCEIFKKTPPDPNWDGAIQLTSK